jgi:seryl-tRNA synthetase
VEEGRALKDKEGAVEAAYQSAEAQRRELQLQVPNFTHPDAPIGKDESANLPIRSHGEVPRPAFPPKDHLALMEGLDLVDFEGGAKVAGQKFYYLKNEAVLLELALVQFALRLLQEEGFTLFITPDLARQEILNGIGFNPRGESTQIYSIENSDLSLVATAEITLGGLLADEILEAERLPLLYAGLSHCFRTEAGSAGRESRGLYRVHQFTKVEMFAFTRPEDSEAMHERFVAIEENIYRQLEVPYRVVDICTGDLGAPAYRKYDLEAWMPGRGQWGEITSTSNCTDYQARRLNIRYKEKGGKGTSMVHMLNGTAVAVSRSIIALVENGQQADGSIRLPRCLGLADIRPR